MNYLWTRFRKQQIIAWSPHVSTDSQTNSERQVKKFQSFDNKSHWETWLRALVALFGWIWLWYRLLTLLSHVWLFEYQQSTTKWCQIADKWTCQNCGDDKRYVYSASLLIVLTGIYEIVYISIDSSDRNRRIQPFLWVLQAIGWTCERILIFSLMLLAVNAMFRYGEGWSLQKWAAAVSLYG